MSDDYKPDKWCVLKLITPAASPNVEDSIHYRVYGSWYGGWAGSDSWRMNSGITKATLLDGFYAFDGFSGSLYYCDINQYGTSGYGGSVLAGIISRQGDAGTRIDIMPEETDFSTLDYKNERKN